MKTTGFPVATLEEEEGGCVRGRKNAYPLSLAHARKSGKRPTSRPADGSQMLDIIVDIT